MDPLTAGAIMGGTSLLGTYMTNQMNRQNADRMMDFQRDMSGSAHQREVNDLRLAGLNPILSAGGSGASTPGGAQFEAQDPLKGVSAGMDTAIAIRSQNKDLAAKDAGIANADADTSNKKATADLIRNQTAQSALDINQKKMSNQIMHQTLDSQIKKAKAEGDYSEINQIMSIINSGANSASSLINPLKFFGGKK